MKPTRLASALVCLLISAPITAAAWNANPAQNDLLLHSTDDELSASHSWADGAGEIATVAIDRNLSSGDTFLTFNRSDMTGSRLYGETGVRFVQTRENTEDELHVLPDGQGGAYCVVLSRPPFDLNPRYRMYRVDGSGVLLSGTGGQLLTTDPYAQSNLEMIPDGQGGVILVFEVSLGGLSGDDIRAQRVDDQLDPVWASAGVSICDYNGNQGFPDLVSDGAGGAIVAWEDARSGVYEIYGQRIDAQGLDAGVFNGDPVAGNGFLDARYPYIVSDGYGGALVAYSFNSSDVYIARYEADRDVPFDRAVTEDPEPQSVADLVADGVGGAFLLWRDSTNQYYPSMYVQYLSPQGSPRWNASGLRVATASEGQNFGRLALDGSGGVVAAWNDSRNGYYDIYAQRINSVGDRKWDFDGIPVSLAGGFQYLDALVATGDGALYVAFEDTRGPDGRAAYVQRLDPAGYTGDPRPVITAVDDFPQDQGGVLLVEWTASERDTVDEELIAEYLVLRRLAVAPAKRAPVEARQLAAEARLDPAFAEQLVALGWEYLGAVEALQLPAYAYSAPSYGDQTPSTSPVTEFLVIARAAPDGALFESLPVGGTSTDDLAPGVAKDLLAVRNGSLVEVRWQPPQDPVEDLLEYRIYRSADVGFVPDGASLVGATGELSFNESDPGGGPWYYRVTAVDVHTNEGAPSLVAQLDALTAAGDAPLVTRSRIGSVSPNPFNPRTEIRLDLAQTEHVRLAVFDVRGRTVATLLDAQVPSGTRKVSWNGVGSDHAAVASGTYFLQMETDSVTDVRRVTLVK